jgi:anthranilate/para-aminobenzoate synthase component I
MTDNTHRPENWDAALSLLSGGNPALVWRRVIADTETPVGAAVKLFAGERGDFLLESVEGGEVRGRYSLLGLAPDLVFRATGHAAEINRVWATDREAFEPLADDASMNCARWWKAAGWMYRPRCRLRWPASWAISAMRRSALSKSCPVRRKARWNCRTCCLCARR